MHVKRDLQLRAAGADGRCQNGPDSDRFGSYTCRQAPSAGMPHAGMIRRVPFEAMSCRWHIGSPPRGWFQCISSPSQSTSCSRLRCGSMVMVHS